MDMASHNDQSFAELLTHYLKPVQCFQPLYLWSQMVSHPFSDLLLVFRIECHRRDCFGHTAFRKDPFKLFSKYVESKSWFEEMSIPNHIGRRTARSNLNLKPHQDHSCSGWVGTSPRYGPVGARFSHHHNHFVTQYIKS